jgi:phospholipid/cholesterol/gamma-HCH transport system substrate-binding protein
MNRWTRAGAVVATLALGGCSALGGGVYDTPLPGGADVGDHPITLTADFEDALDLVPQSGVRVDDVAVGRVSSIELAPGGRSARVELVVDGDVDLPAGTTARLQQTSLLGEKYVALVRPAQAGAGELEDGDHLGDEATSQSAQVEQVLGALSLVLNGGGVGQFQEISRELQQAGDDPQQIKAFLDEMATFTSGLDDRKESVTAAIDSLAALSKTLEADQDKIATALEDLEPGLAALADQRADLVKMLAALDDLSDVAVDTLDKAQADIVADLELLAPVLQQLGAAGSDLPRSLEILLTYPFPDSVLGAVKGDYLNVFLTTRFRTQPAGCTDTSCDWPQVAAGTGRTQSRYVPKAKDDPEEDAAKAVPSPVRPTPSSSPSATPTPGASPRSTPSPSSRPSSTPTTATPSSPATSPAPPSATDDPKEQH